jgi:hypothetical protein
MTDIDIEREFERVLALCWLGVPREAPKFF